ncbi:DUF1214 domain-containing protein [Sebaldella sp. S0638]|uniref:DUF1214 domain-containing protein n=1 Tax=Sebaldella sp. S0638 TaxID=2957809 RepID=UPI0020A063A8|nr:DUF1214 domain-containing protein [Sebaldella sp. S0638]MCP1224220.1 DUF1214 domain-containing protein [Sebaldella sp. S0638]
MTVNMIKKQKFAVNNIWKVFLMILMLLITIPGFAAVKPSEQEIKDGYLYMIGRYIVIRQENQDINVEKVGYNKIKYNPLGSAEFVNPNMDVAYLESWIAVDKDHAVIMNVPEIKGRYYTVQVLNGWGEVVTNINERNYPNHPYGKFAFVLKGSNPKNVPKDAQKIEIPFNKVKVLARVELQKTPEEAEKLQKEFTLDVPEGIKIDPPLAITNFTNAKPIGSDIFLNVDKVLASYPDVMPSAAQYQKTVKNISGYMQSSAEAKKYVSDIVDTKIIPEFLEMTKKGSGSEKNGWIVSYVMGNFGDDYIARDIVNYAGLWGNTAKEAIYFVGVEEGTTKQPLNGSNTYQITFPKGALPESEVDAFWSVTLYGTPDYRLVQNPINKYGINNVTGVKTNKDGSLTIWIAPTQPKGVPESNWLPSASGKGFALTLRLYVPKQDVLNQTWYPPVIKQVK